MMTAGALTARWPRWSVWVPGVAGAALLAGLAVSMFPWVTAGVVIGALLLVGLLLRPFTVVALLLALGPVDLSFLTGGFKGLFVQLGGFDMNGIRLIGVVAGFAVLMLAEREMLRHSVAWYGRWYFLFLGYALFALAYSMAPLDGLRFFFKLAYPFVVFVAVLTFARSRADLARLGDVVLAAAALIALLINPIYVLAGGYILDSSGYIRTWGVGAHQNPFAFYLVLMILFAYQRFTVRGDGRYLLLCGVLAVWVVLTVTRIALVGAVVGLGGAALYTGVVNRNYRAIAGAMTVAAVVVVPLMPFVLQRTFGYIPTVGELFGLMRDPVQLYGAISWQGREIIWPIVFQAFIQSPIYGLGLGSQTAVVVAAIPAEWGTIVHNEYLRLVTDLGLLGGVWYALALGAWFVAVAKAGRSEDPLVREYAPTAVGALLVWGVVAITDNAFDYYAPFTQFVAFFCAATLAAARLQANRQGAAPANQTGATAIR
jgi:O-antigen ligase